MPVTYEQFKNAFIAAADRYRLGDAVRENWVWLESDRKDRDRVTQLPPRGQVTTDDLTRSSQRVLFDVADALGLDVTWECPPGHDSTQKLDAALFGRASRLPEVAWEHANLIKNGPGDARKLLLYPVPLRVLATYPTPEEPNSLSQLVGECNHIVPHQPKSSFLIILGMPDGTWQFRSRQPSGFEEAR
ncbi:MAG TPA: hypothetical protein VMH22_03905 [bacterium]|nr:hypothetical protein [bacterium]